MNIMPAGREIDLLIAREVFGLTRPPIDTNAWGNPLNWVQHDSGTWFGTDIWPLDGEMWNEVSWPPEYSTGITAAWEIVAKMLRDGVEVVVMGGFSGNLSACMMFNGCPASYPPRDAFLYLANKDANPFTTAVRVQARTTPLAICRAALEVVRLCKEKDDALETI